MALQSVLETGKKLSDDNTIGQEEIQQRLAQFVEHWKELKDLAAARWELYFAILLFSGVFFFFFVIILLFLLHFRSNKFSLCEILSNPKHLNENLFGLPFFFSGQRLEESLEYQQFVANVEEEEAWINEKLNLVGSEDYGDTLAAVQVWKLFIGWT